jgi:uncharacterized protein YyaL (SSP411 family)
MNYKHTNRLIKETSPYLLQHAHNPVNWYPWGPEALQKAREENKIILVSIGYAACHWCHVMERESFENETVAERMNLYFINIKIDREERPDLDHIYMDAVQAITGSGGWPLNVFLTPHAKPFYGGTYFPPVNAYNRSSWTEVIEAIAAAWKQRSHEIESQAENLLAHIKQVGRVIKMEHNTNSLFTKEHCFAITENVLKQADKTWGGFGKAPKFPQTFSIQYLLQYYHFTGHKEALQQALLSLDKMIAGGIYDHAGGGFARYSTDTEWLAPHFEKMLYDNALLLQVLCDAFQLTGNKKYKEVILHTIDFLKREMMDEHGGFYAALDADSEGEEGKFYVWELEEIKSILGTNASLFCSYYDVTEKGNWEEKNILRTLTEKEKFVKDNNLDERDFENKMQVCLQQLLQHRSKRQRPSTDNKILLGWNALLVTALCKCAAAFNNQQLKAMAVETGQFLINSFKKSAPAFEYYHVSTKGRFNYPAFIDDYAFLIQACINLQEITSDAAFLETAINITSYVIENFYDSESGLFTFTHKNQQDVIVQKKEVYDGATPSGNSVMADNLYYLSVIANNNAWADIAEMLIQNNITATIKYPTSFGVWSSVILKQSFGIQELVITGTNFKELRNTLLQQYLPAKVLQCNAVETARWPLLNNKGNDGDDRIFWCRQYSCMPAVKTVENLMNELSKDNYSTGKSQ